MVDGQLASTLDIILMSIQCFLPTRDGHASLMPSPALIKLLKGIYKAVVHY